MALFTLFISAFTSATLLPGSSEALFLLMLSQESWNTVLLIVTAGVGNSLGGMTNWVLGVLIRNGLYHDKSPDKSLDKSLDKSQKSEVKNRFRAELWLQKYGSPALFFSFLPIIGDPLCLVAGLVKIHWFKAIIFITLGKFFRYFVLSSIVFS